MRYLSVCSGIEAASVAWHDMGWTPVGFSEIEPFPCEVLKQRFPNVKNYGDLTNFAQWDIEPGTVDVLVGGPPCQAFSVAGLREGMADPRGNLSLIYFGLVKRLKPKWIVYENVPGLLSARSGSDFSALLSALAECGYGFAYRMLDSQHFGLAQRRQRIFIVGCRSGDWRHSAAVLFDGPGSFGHFKKGEDEGKETASPSGASVGTASRINCQPDGISGTVTNKWHKGSGGPAGDEHYNLIVRGVSEQASQLLYENHPNDSRVTGPHDIAPTIAARFGTGGGNVPFVQNVSGVAIPIDTRNATRDADKRDAVNRQGVGIGDEGDPCGTITSSHISAVAFQPGNLARRAGSDPSTEVFPTLSKDSGDQNPHVAIPMGVRRLLPSECESLQGFPKDWTKISWKGKPPEQCPDGPRYKAIGNSMATNCMKWIGRRIQLVDDLVATLPKQG
ncbi:Dcm Site-specific DNA methylase [uncultured Caudovirales phage]|uniref:Cytosine-specific methyltransferase n=1 Tax=uncultured Caudovirales phage TaxID=2100421 RepID=A0A6J5M1Y5_9CAUD|nr:Dcm Site-specific DNA methylase [uncultured Caudovirales phage]